MDRFYTLVLGVATLILILILIFVGIMMQYQNAGNVWPPINNTCPDYWKVAQDGIACEVSIDGANIGTLKAGDLTKKPFTQSHNKTVLNPADPSWLKNGLTPQCSLGAWANQNNIQWSGYSNNNSCK